MALRGGDQGVADLVVGDDHLFLVGEDGVLLLIADDDHFDALFEIRLRGLCAAVAHGAQRRLVDDVGQLGAGSAGSHARHLVEIDAGLELDLFGVHLEDVLAAFQVGQLHGHAPVEAAGARQRRVERLGAVRGGEDDHARVVLEAVHLREQLVKRLFALVVAHHVAAALRADGVDLVNEDDAGRFFLGLLEQIAHFRGPHAHEHLHELGAGHGEERHVRLARHCLGQHGLAGAGRPDEQNALGHLRANVAVAPGIVQILDDLRQVLLGLVLSGHVGELDALGRFDVDTGLALPHAEHHRVAAHAVHELFLHVLPQPPEEQQRHDPRQQHADDRRRLLDDLAGELGARLVEALRAPRVVHRPGAVHLFALGVGEEDLILLDVDLADLFLFGHPDERAVIHLVDLRAHDPRLGQQVEEHQHEHGDHVIINQRLSGIFDFVHGSFPLCGIRFRVPYYTLKNHRVCDEITDFYQPTLPAKAVPGRCLPPGTARVVSYLFSLKGQSFSGLFRAPTARREPHGIA